MADQPTAAIAAKKHKNHKVGLVVSRSGNKTIVVEVTRRVQHPLYKRYINKTKKFYAHDEQNECQAGDHVRIVETRRLSALKRWRLVEIVLRGKGLPPVSELADAPLSTSEEAAS
jgi:small subunit ribosomal protein S17